MEWKDVVGYEELFQVSDQGHLWSKRSNKELKVWKHPHGYLHCATKIGGRKGVNICFKLHRVVAEAFLMNPEKKPFVNHIDGDKTNNKVSNLEWVTAQENSAHAISLGLQPKQQKSFLNNRSSLTKSQVKYCLENYIPYCRDFGLRGLARKFSVDKNTIKRHLESQGGPTMPSKNRK